METFALVIANFSFMRIAMVAYKALALRQSKERGGGWVDPLFYNYCQIVIGNCQDVKGERGLGPHTPCVFHGSVVKDVIKVVYCRFF